MLRCRAGQRTLFTTALILGIVGDMMLSAGAILSALAAIRSPHSRLLF